MVCSIQRTASRIISHATQARDAAERTWIAFRNMSVRGIKWGFKHNIASADVLLIAIMAWWAVALYASTNGTRDSGLYHFMRQLLPIEAWAGIAASMVVIKIVGIIRQSFTIRSVGLIMMTAWWITMGGYIWVSVHTLLSTSVYVIVAITAIYRYAELQLQRYE